MYKTEFIMKLEVESEYKDVIDDIKDHALLFLDDSCNIINREYFNKIGEVNDGSHSFDELYYHRMMLFSVICNTYKEQAWKSWKHDDNTMYDDYFIVGISTKEGDYTYHYHKDFWDNFKVKEISNAPAWDGHKPEDITRLLTLLK